jgi:hypothetical protein
LRIKRTIGGLLGLVVGLLLLDGAVIVDEDKGLIVLRVLAAAGASVAWAQVTLIFM